MAIKRCFGDGDPLMSYYHDEEWGVPVLDDRRLFEKLILDGFQAGLSWRTVLYKREAFQAAFDGFEPERIAAYTDKDRARLLANEGIIRNRLKIDATISNAQAYLDLARQGISFSELLWSFVGGQPQRGPQASSWDQARKVSPEAEAMSKVLKSHGFKFVGPTICYAFMQAVGMVDDHLTNCFRYSG
jgi:DNA-3-methyladenine glycosylase I